MKSDAHPEAEQVQVAILRQAPVTRRLAMTRALTESVYRRSMHAIRRAHPELNDEEIKLFFVRLNYGADLAGKLATYLSTRKPAISTASLS